MFACSTRSTSISSFAGQVSKSDNELQIHFRIECTASVSHMICCLLLLLSPLRHLNHSLWLCGRSCGSSRSPSVIATNELMFAQFGYEIMCKKRNANKMSCNSFARWLRWHFAPMNSKSELHSEQLKTISSTAQLWATDRNRMRSQNKLE